MKEYYRVQADICLDAIFHNLERTKKKVNKGTKIMVVIKADGYGHGAIPIAKVVDPIVDAYGVAILEEGIELRRAGIKKPILILGVIPEQLYSKMIEYDIMATVFQYNMAKEIGIEALKQKKIAKIHLKIDTGMSRIGFLPNQESVDTIKKIASLEGIEIEGCFTHFAKADFSDKTSAYEQWEQFQRFLALLLEEGISIPIKHVSNSAGIIDMPKVNMDMVRSGISTYGLYPSDDVNKNRLILQPAMSIHAVISYVKTVGKGVEIGYGGTYVTKRETVIATIPVGYGDGYPRALSNQGRVLIHGKSAPVLGRICMDQFMVDVTEIEEVKQGDRVTLLGVDGEEQITVNELSELSGLFHYEFVCNISKRVPRVYYYENKKIGTLDFYNCIKTTYELELL